MSGKTDGQRAYEAAREPGAIGWETLPPEAHVKWAAIARAGAASAHDQAAGLLTQVNKLTLDRDWQESRADLAIAERDDLIEQLAGIRERLENLATGLELSAMTSHPSKKSQIELGCAAGVREIAKVPGITGAGTEYAVAELTEENR